MTTASHPVDGSTTRPGYRPIGDYAAIGDCRSVALVSRDGSVDWLCWPGFASPAIFAALLDRRRGGFFRVAPSEPASASRRYRPGTNVLETTWRCARGSVRVVDALILGSGGRGLEPQRELLRTIECLDGAPRVALEYVPRPGYGLRVPALRARGRCIVLRQAGAEVLLHASAPLALAGTAAAGAELTLTPGERHQLSLSYVGGEPAVLCRLGADADRRLERTSDWWRRWRGRGSHRHMAHPRVERSALVLKLLAHALSGAIVAAPTASLPEWIGGARNWDYRYCWLRDASLTLGALLHLGYPAEARAFLDWLLHTTRLTRPRLRVVYDVYGSPDLPERELDHLEGYRGSRPVRVGNRAGAQRQLDVYGEVCRAASIYVEAGGALGRSAKRLLAGFGRQVLENWRLPDHGLWEPPQQRQHTYSKLMGWVALDCLLKLDAAVGMPIDAARLDAERGAIRRWIEREAWNPRVRSYVAEPGTTRPDASLLALSRTGFVAAHDARMRATFAYLDRTLGAWPFMYRYPPGSDGIPGTEGAFGIASFWAVEYLAAAGRAGEARGRFDALLAACNDVGLMGEEIDPATGAQLGNFPQAFTHVGLVMAAAALDRVR